ncbi:rhodanese-like domain-containing protein [Hydrogenophaga defluvii]|uniref:Rhodanese-like domain-containing protein n=1 Tax=Hydrogenophaga defluvii TaxID=249410 RepID=A0ABW2SF58_9BURK
MMPTRRSVFTWLVTCGWTVSWPVLAQGGPAVSLEAARAAFEAGKVTLIDIREPDEHATGVAAGAQLLPMRQLAARLNEIPKDSSRPVLLICNTQNRSRAVQQALKDRGYHHVQYVNGGMSEWARRGWPMVKPGAAKGPLK